MRLALRIQSSGTALVVSKVSFGWSSLPRSGSPPGALFPQGTSLTAKGGFCTILNFSETSCSHIGKSKELATLPFALHSKLSANQESNSSRQEKSFSMPTSAQQDSQEPFFGQTVLQWKTPIICAQVMTVQSPLPLLRLCPDLTSAEDTEVLMVSVLWFSSGPVRWHQGRLVGRVGTARTLPALIWAAQPQHPACSTAKRLHHPSPEVPSSLRWRECLFTKQICGKRIWRKLFLLFRQIGPFYLILCNKSSDNNIISVKKNGTRRWPPALKMNILAAPSLFTSSRSWLYRHCSVPLALSQLMNTGWVRHIHQPLLQNYLSICFSQNPALKFFASLSSPHHFFNAVHFIWKTRTSLLWLKTWQ